MYPRDLQKKEGLTFFLEQSYLYEELVTCSIASGSHYVEIIVVDRRLGAVILEDEETAG
jgi:hypothetical protein